MALNVPRSQRSSFQFRKKEPVPTEQILQVLGQNPYAQALDQIGPSLSKALELRTKKRRQANQVGAIAKATGISLEGIEDPAVASSIAKSMADNKSEEARAAAALEERRRAAMESNELRKLLAQSTISSRDENRQLREEQFNDKQVNLYSANLEKTGIVNAIGTANRVLELLPERGTNIPGYGEVDSLRPDWLTSQAGRDMRGAVAQLFNIELKDRSGVAVTDQELNRLKQEFGQGKWFASEESLRTGIMQYIKRLREVAANIESGVAPGIRSEYIDRGGRDVGKTFEGLLLKPAISPAQKSQNFRSKYGY